ncbi:MAG: FTR1 family protein [Candidatus Magasanikbacteria bacterium]|nr:FTR1 family protein [Candidatus Magasanikbacteria bacterium]
MLPSLIITFREVLEVALIVGVVISYLARTNQTAFKKSVYFGLLAGIFISILSAVLFEKLAGGFSGQSEEVFEGVMMLVGASLLTTMIIWMRRQQSAVKKLEARVEAKIVKAEKFGLFFLMLVSVWREGVELIIFLASASLVAGENNIIGALLGMGLATTTGLALFVWSRHLPLKRFFNITSILLILFAAGLVAHGVHEFHEAGLIPEGIKEVWNINPAVSDDGSFPLWHDKGALGSILKGLFGYNGNPSLVEVVSYLAYLSVAFWFFNKRPAPLSLHKSTA